MSRLKYPKSFSPTVRDLLDNLHAASTAQEANFDADAFTLARDTSTLHTPSAIETVDASMRDKLVAIDNDKALAIYNLILARGARRIVEVGTSFGVSTIYLALAAIECGHAKPVHPVRPKVIATEKESSKAEAARRNWKAAGVDDVIDLRVGDLQETLRDGIGNVDFVLLDIWPYLAMPALELLLPQLNYGAVVVTDNVVHAAEGYSDLLGFLRGPEGPFESVTLPYHGGMEFSVYMPNTTER
ncbi:S-adenosyl-L-methionine-dependent methyltransferase [Pseudovirgaria hyperparasitica]|uniref:S-adenosyl-L-methionine-dependent methyltransferase n=1 Tax=Pseudovirgaria hyperparasitica TaxID=470096 RepID=A0A6A6W9X7_9PEZI|nr:S-adenosyl-L-methionine-dependent methyltransferase [Pseudovirgaria hyperparasitica]KAF2759668.1 S-adenosyl-L-methionine-dependent methyltransferase [Pseudovirgaria hyperparasitica]